MRREIREQARELRENGHSIRDISKRLNVSKGSVSLWVRDIKLTHDQVNLLKENHRRIVAQMNGASRNEKKFRELRLKYQADGRAKAREGHVLHLAGCMLYWAEGAKDKNELHFVNSDANMLQLFIKFLREELGLQDSEIRLKIHCHSSERQVQEITENYWLTTLQLPAINLRKTMFKQGSETSRNILPYGVCAIRVHRTWVAQHIFGAIQEYAGFDKPEWLA